MDQDNILATMPEKIYGFNQVKNPELWVAILGRCMASVKLKRAGKNDDLSRSVGSFAGIALSFIKDNIDAQYGEYTFVLRYRGHSYDVRMKGHNFGLNTPSGSKGSVRELSFHDNGTYAAINRDTVKRWCSETADISWTDINLMGATAYDFCSRYNCDPTGHVMGMLLYLMEIIDRTSGEREFDVKDAYCMGDKIPGEFHISIKLLPLPY